MNDPIRTFTVVDARTLDGDPYEVAEAAVLQALALAELASEYTDIALRMARNASDERELFFNGGNMRLNYHSTPEFRNFAVTKDHLAEAIGRLRTLVKSVAYNPRAKVVKA